MRFTTISLQTPQEGFVDITRQVQAVLDDSGADDGLCVINCPHTTAGLTVNENADPDVQQDMLLGLREAFPDRPQFRHFEGNSSAHLRASAVGFSQTIPVQGGRMVLGRWQAIYFCEFDGPRSRTFHITILEGH